VSVSGRLRSYDPRSGRWTARDPLMLAAGDANLYRYSGNDPIGRLDRGGLADIGAPAKTIPRNRPDGTPYAIERYAQPSFNCRDPGSAGEWFACTTNGADRMAGGGIGNDKFESGEAAFALATVFKEIGERIMDSCFPTPPNPPAVEIDPKLIKAFKAGRPPTVPPEFRRR